ncbi:MAG TPA: hypothetical protein GX699_04570 [Firmicutes bacterium]|nr:hypothetical protein [Bacillota bacterium]
MAGEVIKIRIKHAAGRAFTFLLFPIFLTFLLAKDSFPIYNIFRIYPIFCIFYPQGRMLTERTVAVPATVVLGGVSTTGPR